MLMRYCANATASGLPDIVMVRSVTPLSLSSQLDIRIMAPDICLISAIFVPPFPIMQPISSFGTVISWVCWFEFCWFLELDVLNCEPANAANARKNHAPQNLKKATVYFYSLVSLESRKFRTIFCYNIYGQVSTFGVKKRLWDTKVTGIYFEYSVW